MLEQFLPAIKDPGDYLTALSLFKADAPLTAEEAEKLLAVYARYLPEAEDPQYLKICLAADLLPGREREDAADFAPLELGEATLDALFAARMVAAGKTDLTAQRAEEIVAMVQNEAFPQELSVGEEARVLLARLALDAMSASRDFALLRRQVTELAKFLTGCGTELLDRYTVLAGEVRIKCRR